MNLSLFACVLILLISLTNGFYVPGIAPREFTKGSRIGKFLIADVGNKNPILGTNFFEFYLSYRGESSENDIISYTTSI